MKVLSTTAATILAVGLAAPASAAITFDLTGSPASQASSLSFTESGITLTATPGRFCFLCTPDVTQDATGLGVTGGADTDLDLDGQVDEILTLTFSEEVRLGSALFSDVDSDDDWNVEVDGAVIGNNLTDNPFGFGWITGTEVVIGADGFNDSFRVQELTVAAVPLPAAGFALFGALAAAGVAYRRRAA
jgi:hypothetical protein